MKYFFLPCHNSATMFLYNNNQTTNKGDTMSVMSLILIMLSLGASIIFIGIVLAIASIDECNYRNELYKQLRKDKR